MAKMFGYNCSGKCPDCSYQIDCKKESDRQSQKDKEDQRVHSTPTREEFYEEEKIDRK